MEELLKKIGITAQGEYTNTPYMPNNHPVPEFSNGNEEHWYIIHKI